MKIEIEFNIPDDYPMHSRVDMAAWVLMTCADKIATQMARPPSVCDAPEGADLIRDINGNRIGTVKVTL